jgi:hypothetical protein
MPVQFELPPLLLLGPLVAAVVLYVVLRWVIWDPQKGASPESASQHALWVGVIGWMASSLQGAMNIGIIRAGSTTNPAISPSLLTPETIMPALAWPVLGTLGVHALGQLSYPRPRGVRRKATLHVRRIRDFLPRSLAWTTLAIFTGAAAFIAWTATLPAYEAIPYGTVRGDRPEEFRAVGGDGRIPGIELSGWLGTALAVLAAGTWLVLLVISRRRQLESLTDHDNSLLRTIAMNRLLRTVATVASGLAVIAGNFAARPDPALGSTSWTNFAGLVGVAVLLSMLVWAPPKLAGTEAAAALRNPKLGHSGLRSHPATRLLVSIGAAAGLAAAVPLLVGVFLVPAIVAAGPSGPPVFVAAVAGPVLLVLAAGEMLLARNYAGPGEPRTWPRQPVGPALLTTFILAVLIFVAVLVISAAGNSLLGRDEGWIPAAALAAAGVLLAVPAFLATRRRHGIRNAPPGLDGALRAITLNRIARTLSAMFMAQAAMALFVNSQAWAAVFGVPFMPSIPWLPASLAGTVLAAAAIATALVPVRPRARPRSRPAPLPRKDSVT